jgi:hypothetical protein
LIFGRLQILGLLFLRRCTPSRSLLFVSVGIIHLGQDVRSHRGNVDSNQLAIAALVERLVVFSVDVRRGNTRQLDGDVVHCCADGSGADGVTQTGAPADLRCMSSWLAKEEEQNSVLSPMGDAACRGIFDHPRPRPALGT